MSGGSTEAVGWKRRLTWSPRFSSTRVIADKVRANVNRVGWEFLRPRRLLTRWIGFELVNHHRAIDRLAVDGSRRQSAADGRCPPNCSLSDAALAMRRNALVDTTLGNKEIRAGDKGSMW
jgi:hypothetical protein